MGLSARLYLRQGEGKVRTDQGVPDKDADCCTDVNCAAHIDSRAHCHGHPVTYGDFSIVYSHFAYSTNPDRAGKRHVRAVKHRCSDFDSNDNDAGYLTDYSAVAAERKPIFFFCYCCGVSGRRTADERV
jgi:hypothetical protein